MTGVQPALVGTHESTHQTQFFIKRQELQSGDAKQTSETNWSDVAVGVVVLDGTVDTLNTVVVVVALGGAPGVTVVVVFVVAIVFDVTAVVFDVVGFAVVAFVVVFVVAFVVVLGLLGHRAVVTTFRAHGCEELMHAGFVELQYTHDACRLAKQPI
jgi:hypothetical protein